MKRNCDSRPVNLFHGHCWLWNRSCENESLNGWGIAWYCAAIWSWLGSSILCCHLVFQLYTNILKVISLGSEKSYLANWNKRYQSRISSHGLNPWHYMRRPVIPSPFSSFKEASFTIMSSVKNVLKCYIRMASHHLHKIWKHLLRGGIHPWKMGVLYVKWYKKHMNLGAEKGCLDPLPLFTYPNVLFWLGASTCG